MSTFRGRSSANEERFVDRVRAILAADPAAPFFEGQSPERRLDQTVAEKVIVVHTTEIYGDDLTPGSVDIYVHWTEASLPFRPDMKMFMELLEIQ